MAAKGCIIRPYSAGSLIGGRWSVMPAHEESCRRRRIELALFTRQENAEDGCHTFTLDRLLQLERDASSCRFTLPGRLRPTAPSASPSRRPWPSMSCSHPSGCGALPEARAGGGGLPGLAAELNRQTHGLSRGACGSVRAGRSPLFGVPASVELVIGGWMRRWVCKLIGPCPG